MPQELDISIPIAILDEYLSYRQATWNSATEKAVTLAIDTSKTVQAAGKAVLSYLTFTSSATTSAPPPKEEKSVKNRPAICSGLKNRLKNIQSFSDCLVIISEMAEQARTAKNQTTVAEESEFNHSLHAARTYFVSQLLNSKFKDDYLAHIKKINDEIKTIHLQIAALAEKRKAAYEQGLSISDIQAEIHLVKSKIEKPFQLLLDLQDKDSIYTAAIEDFFITQKIALPTADNALIPFKINFNVPLIYHADYYNMYYATRIAKNGVRKENFSAVLSSPLKDEQEINLADPNFNLQIRNPLSQMLTSHIDLALLAKAGQNNPDVIALKKSGVQTNEAAPSAASSSQGLFAEPNKQQPPAVLAESSAPAPAAAKKMGKNK